MNSPYLHVIVYLLSSLTSAFTVMLLYFLLTFSLGKDVCWLLRLKTGKATVVVVTGVLLMVVMERWMEQVVPALLDAPKIFF